MTFLGPNTEPILTAAVATIVVLGVGGALTEVGAWYASLRKPSWQPPNWLFAPAWTLIGVLTAAAAVLSWEAAQTVGERGTIIALFAVNAAFNIGWSLLFFKLRRPDWALVEVAGLWLSIAALIAGLAPLSLRAGLFLTPYLLWVSFAAVLNRKIVQLNHPFRRFAGLQKSSLQKPSELGS